MKKSFCLFTVLAAVVAMVSCTRDEVREVVAPVSEDGLVTLRVGVSPILTKADDGMDSDGEVPSSETEKQVNSLQVFVFSAGGDGGLEKSVYDDTGVSYVTLTCFAGDKEVVAVVNAPGEINWLGIGSLEELNQEVTRLEENYDGNFFMYGSVSAKVSEDVANDSIEIEVKRRVARVVLNSVTNMVTSGSSVGELVLKSAYLLNVAYDSDYGCSDGYVPSDLYNDSRFDGYYSDIAELNPDFKITALPYPLLYDGFGDVFLEYNVPYDKPHTFYCYPNATDRPTRLVVEATLNNRLWYYPVTIGDIRPNWSYEVDLTITGAGAASPDSDPQVANFEFNVKVADWTLKSINQPI